jgi:hypothetical protein
LTAGFNPTSLEQILIEALPGYGQYQYWLSCRISLQLRSNDKLAIKPNLYPRRLTAAMCGATHVIRGNAYVVKFCLLIWTKQIWIRMWHIRTLLTKRNPDFFYVQAVSGRHLLYRRNSSRDSLALSLRLIDASGIAILAFGSSGAARYWFCASRSSEEGHADESDMTASSNMATRQMCILTLPWLRRSRYSLLTTRTIRHKC